MDGGRGIQVSGEGIQSSGRGIQASAKGIQVVFEGIRDSVRAFSGGTSKAARDAGSDPQALSMQERCVLFDVALGSKV